jgi:hypothetical protein
MKKIRKKESLHEVPHVSSSLHVKHQLAALDILLHPRFLF